MPTGTCAYCGQRSALTREHIWPRCIIERAPAYVMRFSGKANKVFAGDLFVKDVCSACNNGALSALDSYACGLYDEYFCRIVNAEEEVVFRFDHDLLLRWLLKVSYNSALASASDVPFHLPLRHFMLGQSGKPEQA